MIYVRSLDKLDIQNAALHDLSKLIHVLCLSQHSAVRCRARSPSSMRSASEMLLKVVLSTITITLLLPIDTGRTPTTL